MTHSSATSSHCPTCRRTYPATVLICPQCHEILPTPGRPATRRTPRGAVGLLVAIILVLLLYAGKLAWDVLVLHRF